MMHRVNNNILIFGGIKGLVRDGNELRKELLYERPDIILITIAPEEVDGMKSFIKDPFEISLSDYEIIYGINLLKYGEVMTPPPIYIEATKYSMENDIPMIGLDMDENTYQTIYRKHIKTGDLLRHSLRKKKISKIKFENETPEDFVDSWNRIADLKHYKQLNHERVAYIIKKLKEEINENNNKKIICISDYDFYKDIVESFND